jgi:hypothetical protein
MDDAAKNKATADKNLARQQGAEHDPKWGEPGYVYNDEGAKIQNPGPVEGPYAPGPGQVPGERQLGDRVTKADPADIKGFDTPAENPGDKADGEALTPSEPGSASIQRVADKNEDLSRDATTKKAAENAKPKGGK